MKKTVISIISLFTFLVTACRSTSDTPTVSYLTEEDKAEEQTLDSLQATVNLLKKDTIDLQLLSLAEYQFSLRYPQNFFVEKKDSSEYLSRYVLKEAETKDDPKAPSIELRIISGPLENTIKNIEKTMEINSKEQITVGQEKVGVKLVGVESGLDLVLFSVGEHTAILKNSSLSLREIFESMVSTIIFNNDQ